MMRAVGRTMAVFDCFSEDSLTLQSIANRVEHMARAISAMQPDRKRTAALPPLKRVDDSRADRPRLV